MPRVQYRTNSPLPCYQVNGFEDDEIPKTVQVDTFKLNRRFSNSEWGFLGDKCRLSTAQSTPRFSTSGRSDAPAAPAKSVCGDSLFKPYSIYPRYMANTLSFRAKLRSQSAPKQRPEESGAKKKNQSLGQILMASKASMY